MQSFQTEPQAFQAGGDETARRCTIGKPNCGFRILKNGDGFKVLMVPERGDGSPYYL